MSNQALAVIYGKHRAFGDFLARGLPAENLAPLDNWLEQVLPQLRQRLGGNWDTVWAAAPPLRFWIGPNLLGVPLIGVFMTSADKVGRQFPLIFGLTGVLTPPPVDAAFDPAPYAALDAHIADFRMPQTGYRDGGVLLAGFDVPAVSGVAWQAGSDGTLWAHRGDGDLGRLLTEARVHDAAQAQFTRSHWWRDNGWLACNGLPDAAALEWLLSGQNNEEDV